jgi:uncharacterized protein with NAD-binding domain and iron-sulfur cluster
MPPPFAKQQIAILGGGMGGVAAAWAITSDPDLKDRYDITLYQMGWRLGGKGASGRNREHHQRIEEHGLHVWLGFYENAFRAMKACYGELGRPDGAPLATWKDAFKKHSLIVLMDRVNAQWSPWSFDFPEDHREPGQPEAVPFPAVWDYVEAALKWLENHFDTHEAFRSRSMDSAPPPPSSPRSWFERAVDSVRDAVEDVTDALVEGGLHHELRAARVYAKALMGDMRHNRHHHRAIAHLLRDFRERMRPRVGPDLDANIDLRRAWIILALGVTMVLGMLEDGVVTGGFEMIEDEEWIAWLRRHGADDLLTESALVRGLYDLVFGFEGGNPDRPNYAAGTAMRSVMSIAFEYRGAIFWKMQAGMGDTVFGPFYEVLRRRGVKFEFFHQVKHLGLSEDGRSIGTLRIARQVWLRDRERDYEPLVDVKGLPCWPSAPLFDQIDPAQAAELRERGIDLESPSSGWAPCEERTLTLGKDFDAVVLAIPPGAQREICRDLIDTNRSWRSMIDNVKTVATQATQLWLKPDLEGLGWRGESPVLDAYADSLNTWADMSHLIVREDWPRGEGPRNIAYFCGPLADPTPASPLARAGERERREHVRSGAIEWMNAHAGGLWPKATPPGNPAALDYEKLVASAGCQGINRMLEQYFRLNDEGSERYVLSLAASGHYRLKPGASGFQNLFLAGDWTDNGFLNAGCIEATVMSGLQAAKALSGRHIEIAWERPER